MQHTDRDVMCTTKKIGMEYQKGFVVFLDILGFKEFICTKENEVKKVFSIFDFSEKIRHLYNDKNLNGVKIEFFSDSFVLTTEAVSVEAFSMIMIACHLLNLHIYKETGLCTRGAIVIGKFYHAKGIVFGPGIINAYQLENQKAKYIRMLVDKEVADFINNPIMIQKSSDGYYHYNWYVLAIQDCFKDGIFQKDKASVLARKYRDILTELLSQYRNTEVYEKYFWLTYLYNDFCRILNQYDEQGEYIELLIEE